MVVVVVVVVVVGEECEWSRQFVRKDWGDGVGERLRSWSRN